MYEKLNIGIFAPLIFTNNFFSFFITGNLSVLNIRMKVVVISFGGQEFLHQNDFWCRNLMYVVVD